MYFQFKSAMNLSQTGQLFSGTVELDYSFKPLTLLRLEGQGGGCMVVFVVCYHSIISDRLLLLLIEVFFLDFYNTTHCFQNLQS